MSNDDAYSIDQFCARHSISRAHFYKLQKRGEAPMSFYAGARRLISKEAAAAWRKLREEEARRKNVRRPANPRRKA